jgi:hypothetical protein
MRHSDHDLAKQVKYTRRHPHKLQKEQYSFSGSKDSQKKRACVIGMPAVMAVAVSGTVKGYGY